MNLHIRTRLPALAATVAAAALALAAAVAWAADSKAAPTAAAKAASAAGATGGLASWARIQQVFSHPRCANCHVGADGVPMWSGANYGPQPRPHGMNITAGASRIGAENGLLCTTCHMHENAAAAHGPPGAEGWLLAPVSMQWFGKASAEICAQIKDPKRNGGRSLEQVAQHVERDALVGWGWHPGRGREPAPLSNVELAQLVRSWARSGAPCPAP